MGISKTSSYVDRKMLSEGFSKIDPSLEPETVAKLVETLLDGKAFLDMDDFAEMLESYQDNDQIDTNWLSSMINKLNFKLINLQKGDELKNQLKV